MVNMTEKDFLKLQNGSDIRGIALEGVADEHVNLTNDAAFEIGKAFVAWLSKKTGKPADKLSIGVGRDARLTGPSIGKAVMSGIKFAGAQVTDCGLATTPAMYMTIEFAETKFDGSIMITASHLPFNRNGIKFFDKDGGLEHNDITFILQEAAGTWKENNYSEDSNSFANLKLIDVYSAHLRSIICRETKKTKTANHLKDFILL